MTRQGEDRSVDLEMVSGAIAAGFRGLPFPPPLEAYFEAEIGYRRALRLLRGGLAGIVFCFLYLAVDWLLTPDVFALALWLQCGLVFPLSLVVLAVLSRGPPPWLREGIVGAVCIVVVVVTLTVMLKSETALRDGHQGAAVLVVLFLTLVQRLRFPYAVAACAAIFALYAWGLSAQTGYAPERMLTNISLLGCASVLALVGSFGLERELRQAYLLGLRERLRSADLETLSRQDALTGLDNRRSLDEAMEHLADIDDGVSVAVLLLDIDHFKSYNDTVGHIAGDVCLKRVAALIRTELRTGDDIAFRFGGEEFLVLLPAADLATAIAIGERIRSGIEDAAIPHPGRHPPGVVTVSIGVSAARLGGTVTAGELISGADAALYAAKRAGRNQVWPRARPVVAVTMLPANRDAIAG